MPLECVLYPKGPLLYGAMRPNQELLMEKTHVLNQEDLEMCALLISQQRENLRDVVFSTQMVMKPYLES